MVTILLLVLLFVFILVLVFVLGSLRIGNIVLFVFLVTMLLNCLWICFMTKRHYYATDSVGSVFLFDSLSNVSEFVCLVDPSYGRRMITRVAAESLLGHRFSSKRVVCLPVDDSNYSFTYFQFFAC